MKFQGADELTVDAKGRMSIPAWRREALINASAGLLVATAHPHGCLLLYPAPAWEPIRDQVLAASSLNPQAAAIKRLLVGYACEETMDSAGRFMIAPELRKFAQLEKTIFLVGQGSHFEIWSEELWAAQQKVFASLGDALPAGLESLAL